MTCANAQKDLCKSFTENEEMLKQAQQEVLAGNAPNVEDYFRECAQGTVDLRKKEGNAPAGMELTGEDWWNQPMAMAA